MKATLFALVFGLSTSAFACPNMVGNWTCAYDDGTTDSSSVAQAAMTNGTMYTITTSEGDMQLPADGQARPVSDQGLTGTTTVSCQGDSTLQVVEQVAGAAGSQQAGFSANVTMTYTLASASAMNVMAIVTVSMPGQAPQQQTQKTSCTRH